MFRTTVQRPSPRSLSLVLLIGLIGLIALATPVLPTKQSIAQDETSGDASLPAPDDGERERTEEPLSPAQELSDEATRARLQALFDRIHSLENVSVEVEAGVVRLRGEALSLEARQQAVDLAKGAEGVVFVENDLRVITDLRERIDPALERLKEYATGALAFVPLFLVALLLFFSSIAVGSWVSRWDGPHLKFARTPFIRGLFRQLIRVVFVLAGLLLALELLDATALVGAVLGTAGVFGLALGFAFKDIVENHLAGIMMSIRQPFDPSDHIAVAGHEGKVIRLTARETILMTLAGNHVRIPNAEIYRSVMTNYSRNPRRRFDFSLSVGTRDDLLEAQDAGLGALGKMSGVMDDPAPSSRIVELGDSWVTLQFYGWVDQSRADFGRVRSEAIRLAKLALEAAEISMPSPEYVVDLRGGSLMDGAVQGPGSSTRSLPEGSSLEATRSEPEAEEQDVSVDRSLDAQIEEDRQSSDESDLLGEGSDTPAETRGSIETTR